MAMFEHRKAPDFLEVLGTGPGATFRLKAGATERTGGDGVVQTEKMSIGEI